MQKVTILFIILISLYSSNFSFSQKNSNGDFYVKFESDPKCGTNLMKENKENIFFLIRDCKNETVDNFLVDKESKIDTLNSSFLRKVKLYTMEDLNDINWKERKLILSGKQESSVFIENPIYFLKEVDSMLIRYKVLWVSRVFKTISED